MKTAVHAPWSLLFLFAGGLGPVAVHAQSDVTFIDGGYAEMCAAAAKTVGQPGSIQITGSRLAVPPVDICTRAISSDGATPLLLASSYNNRGVLYFAQGAFADAMRDFDEAVRLYHNLAQAHVNRGYTLVTEQRWADSIPAFTRGIELGTTEMDKAYFNRGIAHEETGNARQAYYDYLKASELNPTWQDPRNELARFTVTRK